MGKLMDSIKKSMENKSEALTSLFFLKAGGKRKIRFLTPFDKGQMFHVHTHWDSGLRKLCLKDLGKACPYCKNADIRTTEMYVWQVWDYEDERVKLFSYAANRCTPVPGMVAFMEENGDITDCDFTIKRTGSGTDTTYALIPGKESEFKIKYKLYKQAEVEQLMLETNNWNGNYEVEDEEEGEEEEEVTKKSSSKKATKKAPPKEEEDEGEMDYEDMSRKELYDECIKRGIKAKPKMDADYYIEKLVDDDIKDEEDEEDDDEPWD